MTALAHVPFDLPDTDLVAVSATALTRTYGEGGSAVRASPRRLDRGPQGPVHRRHGPVRRRQVHADAPARRPRQRRTSGAVHIAGEDITRDVTTATSPACAATTSGSSSSPSTCCRRSPPRRTSPLPLAIAGRQAEQDAVDRLLERMGLGRAARPQAGAALRRPAAARRHRPRADRQPTVAVRRRADRQPRLRAGAERAGPAAHAVDEDGQTTVMVTHDARAAAATPTASLFLADGRVVADLEGPTEDAILARCATRPRA